ncbi:MAG: DUF3467 domain-containing protein [Pirellulaceae bacterium]|nr:DUF3467 domain-containing protein [Pirellulaceae bacterium]
MTDENKPGNPDGNGDETSNGPHQQVQVPGVTARVPAAIGTGVISTGAIVMNGPHAFVLDFLQQMGVPNQLVSRVVMPHQVVPRFIQALEQNLANYEEKFGEPMKLPKPANPAKRPSIQEVYDNIKIPDEELAGHFSEGVMIRHSAAEFCFDFVTQFFPNAAVASRVFMSAPHVPPLLEALKGNYQKFQENKGSQPPDSTPPPETPELPNDDPETDPETP